MRTAVVIPARNCANLLVDCLAHVLRQTHVPDEVLIVVAPSADATRRAADGLAGGPVRVLENPAGDRGSGLNVALESTRAELIAMVDAQSRLGPEYLAEAIAAIERSGADVVGGPMYPVGRSLVGRAFAIALSSPFGIGDSQFHFVGTAGEAESVYLGVYRRRVFDRIGRYNTALLRTEDDDLNARARAAGFRIWLDPTIKSTYLCRNDLPSVWRQYFGYGLWKVALATVRSEALRPRHAVPAVFVVAVVLTAVITVLAWWPALPLLAAAYLTAAWIAALRAHGPVAPRLVLPVATLAMHLGYGCGSLAALVQLPRLAARARAGARAAAAEVAV